MEDYAIRRREYVQQIRQSFDEPKYDYMDLDEPEPDGDSPFLSLKIRTIIAIVLFAGFFFCQYNSYPIFRQTPDEIIDMISDNQYYTILQKYVKL